MKLAVLAVGHRQPDWVSAGCAEYLKRMPRELPACGHRDQAGVARIENPRTAARRRKGPYPRCAWRPPSRIVVLDEKGDDLTTLKLAQRLEVWMHDGRDVALLIGGADGLDEEFKQPGRRPRASFEPDPAARAWPGCCCANRSTARPACSGTTPITGRADFIRKPAATLATSPGAGSRPVGARLRRAIDPEME
jgi:23S rRNA (pseudouridine1915-N3)-methyltransferase